MYHFILNIVIFSVAIILPCGELISFLCFFLKLRLQIIEHPFLHNSIDASVWTLFQRNDMIKTVP